MELLTFVSKFQLPLHRLSFRLFQTADGFGSIPRLSTQANGIYFPFWTLAGDEDVNLDAEGHADAL